MAVSKDTFPFAPLGDKQISSIMLACGVASPDDPPLMDGFRLFLGIGRQLALPEYWYRRYLQVTGRMCLAALDVMDVRASVDCNRGALLYAGAVCEAGGLRPLPRDGEVLSEKNDRDSLDLAITAVQAASGIPSFDGLLERLRPLFAADADYDGLVAARVGAGLLHVITTESVMAAETEGEPLSLPGARTGVLDGIRVDKGLREIMRQFDQAWPDD